MSITTEALRNAIAPYLGSVLTPEIAATIEMQSHDRVDRSHDPAKFPVEGYRDITFRVESFRQILPELEVLHELHFAETERHLAGFVLNPNTDYAAERERNGTMVQFTARDAAGALVGNLRMYLARSTHTGNLISEEDTFYLLPTARKGFTALVFLRYMERCLTEILGVREIRTNTKVVNNAHRMMDYRGYQHVANQYIKIF